MKKLIGNTAAKAAAIILSFFTVFVAAVSAVGTGALAYNDFYTRTLESIRKDKLSEMALSESYHLHSLFYSGDNISEYYSDKNYLYEITGIEGEIVDSNYNGEETLCSSSSISVSGEYDDYGYDSENGKLYADSYLEFRIYIPKKLEYSDNVYLTNILIEKGYEFRFSIIVSAVISLVLSAVLLIFLYCSAGHRNGSDTVMLNRFDRLPFDVLTVLEITAFGIGFAVIDSLGNMSAVIISLIAVCTVLYFLLIGYTMSMATRIKTGTLIKNTVLYRLIVFVCGTGLKAVRFLIKNLPVVWKTVAAAGAILFIELLIIINCAYEIDNLLIWWTFISLLLLSGVIYIAVMLDRLRRGGEKIAAGDLEYKIDTSHMRGGFKNFGESLNNINKGLQTAVNERIKSERFKTELITNVSHDIKTPLTSIINYVDLIKKENPEDEKIREYTQVLDRQSSRLKKLIEDLVEASKASTGNLSVHLTECEVGVLLAQTVGEFDDRLRKSEITPVLNIPEYGVKIFADPRHLWRVFENLMSNVCKYSPPSSRVYIDIIRRDGMVDIMFRNISRYELNVSPEELMERFVRGDKARSTEGSGLGLSIARSLVELQNGKMSITVDGDLFKVVLSFREI